MTSERHRWEDAKKLLDAVLDLEPSERGPFLHDACAGRPEVLTEVQSLLSWVDESEGFLDTPVLRVSDLAVPSDETMLIGRTLGPWRILAVIGQGGMGLVYRAERADAAFQRIVAIKVVRRGSLAAEILTRFQRERETLAALDHPNIARVLDGGSTPDGEPYFVMEYVDGIRIDAYCDEHRLTIDQRLALFRTICTAVQHAHQSLVIHRDIKPDNILVSRDGVPKLLDFGIARLLSDQPRLDQDAHAAATWMMTPDYASPEQVSGAAVTTATDVYSLGVLLHVILTGRSPYRLSARSRGELGDQLATVPLTSPSTAVAGGSGDASNRAASRGLSPQALSSRLAGDLDAIVLRALARDQRSRYQSVEQLVDEIGRHQTHQPVLARGRNWSYLAATFARRHRVALSIAASLVLIATLGVVAVVWQAAIAAEARARAERRFADLRRLAHVFMFDVHDQIVDVPGTTRARELMVRTGSQYLDGLAREASGDLALQRELAGAFVRVGDAQGHPASANIGDTAGARASYERAIEIAGAVLAAAPNDVETERTRAMAHRRLADVLAWSGDLDRALTHCDLSRTLFAEVAGRSGATPEDQLQTAIAELKLADLLGNPNFPNLRRTADANARYDVALADIRALSATSPDDPRVGRYLGLILERIGTMHEQAAEWATAEAAYQESFEIRQALAARTPVTTDVQRDLAIAYEKLGNVRLATGAAAAAEANYRGALTQFDRLALADPSNANAARSAAISREKLASTLSTMGRRGDAIGLLTMALDTHRRLAERDRGNAQARCDTARLEETLGDIWSADSSESTPAACRYWRETSATRQRLRQDGLACGTDGDLARVAAKTARCR